jgi:hypothetical protein
MVYLGLLIVAYIVLVGGLMVVAYRAPKGFEDERGFHFGKRPNEGSETTELTAVGKQCASERRVATIKERPAAAGGDHGRERAPMMGRADL